MYISLEEAKEIVVNEIEKYDCGIIDSKIIDFRWGTLFYFQSKEFIKTGKNPIIGISPILVDKVNGSTHSINYLETRDRLLEAYRIRMGYPPVIKFPIKEDLETMTDLEKVFALMETTEFVQIEKAIQIVKQKNIFDLDGLGTICQNYKVGNLVESISLFFNHIKGEFILYESPLKTIPKEIELFKDRITGILVNFSKLEELPDSILKLKRLKSIKVDTTPLRKMPFDLRPLTELREVDLENTMITESDTGKFKLPEGCKIKIKTMPNTNG